jgi:hypothetical protein
VLAGVSQGGTDETNVILWSSTRRMFWGSFAYDEKGPCHIWKPQTVALKKKDDRELAQLNEELEKTKRMEWELMSGLERIQLRANRRGRNLQWGWNESAGKLVRNLRGGIDFGGIIRKPSSAKGQGRIPWCKKTVL